MNESKSKKDIFYVILLILSMITMIIGITFTYFSLVAKEKDDNTRIQTGTLAVDYIDGRKIDTYALLPTNEPNLNTEYSVYKKKFSVSSSGSLDQTIDIYIDVTNNEFDENSLKYIIYDEYNKRIGNGSIPKTGRILIASDIYLKSNESKNYTVLIWLQENNMNQDYEQGNTFTGGFDITAVQIKY